MYSQLKSDLETAILAVSSALASGEVIVEYEIGGRRVRRKASDEVLETLEALYAKASRKAAASTSGMRLARLSRVSKIGS